MHKDGFAALAARSTRVRSEHRMLFQGLQAFEQRLQELVAGLNVRGCSKSVCLDERNDSDGDPIGHTIGYLFFDGKQLYVASQDEPGARSADDIEVHCIVDLGIEWQRRLSDPEVLHSLLQDLAKTLDEDIEKTAPLVASLAQFITVEKAQIDSDLDAEFDGNSQLYESWLKARKAVSVDPELSITLSCSHIETVLKKCLKTLGAEGYDEDAIATLISKSVKRLNEARPLDAATRQMLNGVASICHGIATTRNRKSVAHGKSEDYVQPTSDLAQTLNHLAGVVSVFVMKHTAAVKSGTD